MPLPVKLIISNRKNLTWKYGKQIPKLDALLKKLVKADKARGLDTRIVYVDDAQSCTAARVKRLRSFNDKDYKKAVDDLYKKWLPAYIVLLGAGDIVPFQQITNPADDEDQLVPSDLPYACDTPYSRTINGYTGPTRVVGRIPDKPGQQPDISCLQTIIENVIRHKQLRAKDYRNYFSVSAQVWTKSSQKSLVSMFGNCDKLVNSPVKSETTDGKYSATQLKSLTHFYNCHGASAEPFFYGQKGKKNYPIAQKSEALHSKITYGTIVAAECCYGAQLYDANDAESKQDGIAITYLQNGAIAFLGSSTIAYGPSDSNALADLVTQYFVKNILKGDASAGRSFLEARQRFLTDSGPQLDPYELKTLAQFYLLGDPSVVPVKADVSEAEKAVSGTTIFNTRAALSTKGLSLQNSIEPSTRQRRQSKPGNARQLNQLLKQANFQDVEKVNVYSIQSKRKARGSEKIITGETARYRAFIKPGDAEKISNISVLVVKEDNEQLLGWRMYESR